MYLIHKANIIPNGLQHWIWKKKSVKRSQKCKLVSLTKYFAKGDQNAKIKITLTKMFFRQINSLLIYLVNALFSRNFCQKSVRVNFRTFHTFAEKMNIFFRQMNAFTKEVTKELIWRNFLCVIAFYTTFPHTHCVFNCCGLTENSSN